MKKYQRSDIVGVERENERDETYRSKTNPQIDGGRTRFNHHFISPNGSYTAFINRRLKEPAPKRKVKDDAVLMASFFIGASPAFFKDKSRDDIDAFFFEARTSSPSATAGRISSPPSSIWTKRRRICIST